MSLKVTATAVESAAEVPRIATQVSDSYSFELVFDNPCLTADFIRPVWNYDFLVFFEDVYNDLSFEFFPATSDVDCGTIVYELYLIEEDGTII